MEIRDNANRSHDRLGGRCPVSALGHEFDPFRDPYLHAPYSFWKRARFAEPVFFSAELDYWIVTRYADVKAIFADPATFSAHNVQNPITPLSAKVLQRLLDGGFSPARISSNADPPDHTRVRKIAAQAFSPRRVNELEPTIRNLVTRLIDPIESNQEGDLVQQIFYELPVLALFLFLGMPEKDIALIKNWSKNRLLLTWGKLSDDQQLQEAEGLLAYWNYSKQHVESLLANPPDNFVGDLIRARDGDDAILTINEIVTLVYGLLLAGHETTTNMSSNAIVTLLTHRDSWEALCADPNLIPNAVEELLRYDTSVITWRRKTVKAVEIAGVQIPEGANLLLVLGSADRDESHFASGETFDIHRENARDHLAFGFGIHYCLGAALARLELKVILQELTRRLPHLRLVEKQKFDYLPNTSFRGPLEVHVKW